MNKVLTGCGVLGGLAIVAIGSLLWMLLPDVGAARERIETVGVRLAALDAAQPYDEGAPLDAERFAATLAARASLAPRVAAWSASLAPDEDDGTLAGIERSLGLAPQLYEHVADACEAHGVGAREFAAHGRLLWAALSGVAAGAGGSELDPLRTLQPALRQALGELGDHDASAPGFDELVRRPRDPDSERGDASQAAAAREPDPARVEAVRALLGHDPAAVQAAVLPAEVEVVLLRLDALLPERPS